MAKKQNKKEEVKEVKQVVEEKKEEIKATEEETKDVVETSAEEAEKKNEVVRIKRVCKICGAVRWYPEGVNVGCEKCNRIMQAVPEETTTKPVDEKGIIIK